MSQWLHSTGRVFQAPSHISNPSRFAMPKIQVQDLQAGLQVAAPISPYWAGRVGCNPKYLGSAYNTREFHTTHLTHGDPGGPSEPPSHLNALNVGGRLPNSLLGRLVQQKLNDGIFVVKSATTKRRQNILATINLCTKDQDKLRIIRSHSTFDNGNAQPS